MNFLQQFQTIVRQHPDRPALIDCDGQRSTTYGQLADLSARIASKLLRSAAQPDGGCLDSLSGRAVLVCMDRRMEYIAAEIGILMAGGAFVPVLPEYPAERRRKQACSCIGSSPLYHNHLCPFHFVPSTSFIARINPAFSSCILSAIR